jgi:hypothetical protein
LINVIATPTALRFSTNAAVRRSCARAVNAAAGTAWERDAVPAGAVLGARRREAPAQEGDVVASDDDGGAAVGVDDLEGGAGGGGDGEGGAAAIALASSMSARLRR